MAQSENNQMQTRNRMSVAALRSQNNNNKVEIFQSPNNPGKCFFSCGDTTGYMSDKAAAKWNAGDHKASSYEYMEIYAENKLAWIPCMVLKGNGPAKSLGTMED